MPELRQLPVFVTVAEELNLTRAAQRLHLAQQEVSKTITQLERDIGVTLLKRSTHQVRLTRAGASLLESGRTTLDTANTSFDYARAVGNGFAGTVTVGATPAIPSVERQRVADALRTGVNDLTVSMRDVRPQEVYQRLKGHTLDLVLARTVPGDVASTTLADTATMVGMPTGHRMAAPGSISAGALNGANLLVWNPPGTAYTDLLVSRLETAGARVTPIQAHLTGDVASSELVTSDAVALLPEGWSPSPGIGQLTLREQLTLPLLMLWEKDTHPVFVDRVRTRLQRTL